MIPAAVRAEIMRRLAQTEQQERVRIVLAIESGSRAWGFASPDSDFDVRFIYARQPDWYLAVDLEERRDVIEYPITDDTDLNGWDIRKALRLFWKSNPTFIEWIQSPIAYIEVGGFAQGARRLLSSVHSDERGIHHYRSMAKTNYRGSACRCGAAQKVFLCSSPAAVGSLDRALWHGTAPQVFKIVAFDRRSNRVA